MIINDEVEHQSNFLMNEPDDVAYGLHSKLASYIGTYNQVRILYKAMATTWMVATGLGMLYLISGEKSDLSIGAIPSVALLGLFSLVGVLAIFYWDVFVYTRHLHAVYHSLVTLESAYNSLPNSFLIHKDLMIRGSRGPEIYDGYLYATYCFVLLIIIGSSLVRYILEINPYYVPMATTTWVILSVATLMVMVLRSRSVGTVMLPHHQKAN